MNKRLLLAKYLVSDWVTACLSWSILFAYRKVYIESAPGLSWNDVTGDFRCQLGLLVIPFFWIFIHGIAGLYFRPLKRHRILEIGQVTWTSLLGGLILFFGLLLDDAISSYQQYYGSLSVLILSRWSLTMAGRLWITTRTVKRIHTGQWSFPTLVIGGNERAVRMVEEIRSLRKDPGYRFEGFIQVNGADTHPLYGWLKGEAKGIMGTERIKWNFTKFLINADGQVAKRYGSQTKPAAIAKDIEALL